MPLKRFSLIIIPVAIILLGWLIIRTLPPKEPSYRGRKLSEWLLPYSIDEGEDRIGEGPEQKKHREEATEAIHAIGTNAIPILLEWLQAKDSPLKLKLLSLAEHQSLVRIPYLPPYFKQGMAKYGFSLLGKDAKSAVPALVRIGQNTNYDDWDMPFICLMSIDTNAANKLANERILLERKVGHAVPTNSSPTQ